MKRLKFIGLLVVVLSILAGGSARADAPLKFTDEAGDALDTRASQDILSVTIDKRQMNKAGPPSLVFELELAAPPESTAVTYGVRTTMEGCGSFQAQYRPGGVVYGAAGVPPADFQVGCLEGAAGLIDAQFRITGNVLRWSVALDNLPKEYRTGTLGSINAYTSISEPVSGFIGTGDLDAADGPLPIDLATTDKTWSY